MEQGVRLPAGVEQERPLVPLFVEPDHAVEQPFLQTYRLATRAVERRERLEKTHRFRNLRDEEVHSQVCSVLTALVQALMTGEAAVEIDDQLDDGHHALSIEASGVELVSTDVFVDVPYLRSRRLADNPQKPGARPIQLGRREPTLREELVRCGEARSQSFDNYRGGSCRVLGVVSRTL